MKKKNIISYFSSFRSSFIFKHKQNRWKNILIKYIFFIILLTSPSFWNLIFKVDEKVNFDKTFLKKYKVKKILVSKKEKILFKVTSFWTFFFCAKKQEASSNFPFTDHKTFKSSFDHRDVVENGMCILRSGFPNILDQWFLTFFAPWTPKS